MSNKNKYKRVGDSTTSSTDNIKRKEIAIAIKAKIISETSATVPANRARLTIGVGETVKLTFNLGTATWATSKGKLSATNAINIIFTAPDRVSKVTITASGSKHTASIIFNVIEPSGVTMARAPGTGIWHVRNIPSVGMKTSAYITPATVSFENIDISEGDAVGTVTGYFVGTSLDGIHHAGHGAGIWATIGTVVAGKGSQLDGIDNPASGHCNFGLPYSAGSFDWPIPWSFRVGTGAAKKFATVHHLMTINASGDMTISKAGVSARATLASSNSNY
jgi:hypothetical protein